MIARYIATIVLAATKGVTITDRAGYRWQDDGTLTESIEVVAESMAEAVAEVCKIAGEPRRVSIERQREVLIPERLAAAFLALEHKKED